MKIIFDLKSNLFFSSSSEIDVSVAFASFITSSGNSYGKSYSFINDNISIPAISTFPRTSVILPSAFLPFSGYFVNFTTTFSLFFAPPKFFFDINISEPNFLSSGTTKPKFLLNSNIPTKVSFSCVNVFIILPSLCPFLLESSIISTNTLSPFRAFPLFLPETYISSSSPSTFIKPKPLSLTLNFPVLYFLLSNNSYFPFFVTCILYSFNSSFKIKIKFEYSCFGTFIILAIFFAFIGTYASSDIKSNIFCFCSSIISSNTFLTYLCKIKRRLHILM